MLLAPFPPDLRPPGATLALRAPLRILRLQAGVRGLEWGLFGLGFRV